MLKNTRYLPFLCALSACCLFSFAYFFSVTAMDAVQGDNVKLLAFRLSIAALVMTALRAVGVLKVSYLGRDWRILAVAALLSPVLNSWGETFGLHFVPSSQFAIIYAASPILTTLLGMVFLRDMPSRRQVFFILVTVAGLVIVNSAGQFRLSLVGLGFPLFCLITGSFNNMLVKKAFIRGFSPFDVLYFSTCESALVFTVVSLGSSTLQGKLLQYFDGVFTLPFLGSVLYLAIMCSIIAFALTYYASSRLPLPIYASFSCISSVLAILIGVFMLHEDFSIQQMIGAPLILGGVFCMNLTYVKSAPSTPAPEEGQPAPAEPPASDPSPR